MLLEFSLFLDGRGSRMKIHVNPLEVASVIESERRPMDAFAQPVAIVTMQNGHQHVVYDYARDVASRVAAAMAIAAENGDS